MGDIILTPSRQHRGEDDILVNERSVLTCVRNLAFCFDDLLPNEQGTRSLADIISDPREYQMVSTFE